MGQDPHDPAAAAALHRAFQHYQAGDVGGAVAQLQALLARAPGHAEARLRLAICLQRLDRHAEVLALADALLAQDPTRPVLLDLRAKSLWRLDRLDEAAAAGTAALRAKDAAQPDPQPPWPLPAGPLPPGRGVVSMSLWGTQPRHLRGALRNALLMPDLYPGWGLRVHADDSVPAPFLDTLRALQVDLRLQPAGQTLRQRQCWRFAVADDPAVGRYLVRDADAVISPREAALVEAWVGSGRHFHVIRDWWTHTEPMLAGLWGGVAGALPPMAEALARSDPGHDDDPGADQTFLRTQVWPRVRRHALVHDRCFSMPGSLRVPAPMGMFHIGQDEHAAHPRRQRALLAAWIERLPCLQDPADDAPEGGA